MKKLLFLLLALPTAAFASGAALHLDRAPVNPNDQESLQRGARVFVNYCLSCHAASYMRYNRMQDFGLTEPQIKDNLLFAAEKPGETMRVAMKIKDAGNAGGPAPAIGPWCGPRCRASTSWRAMSVFEGLGRLKVVISE